MAKDLETELVEARLAHLKTGQRLMEAAKVLKVAVGIIRQWHGMGMPEVAEKQAWEIYWKNAPEMTPIRKFQESVKQELEASEASRQTEDDESKCPKCGTKVVWVVPPIPKVKPFFQCEDPDCNWLSGDPV
jgi:endogenous inhibitor of DNA gyrase (YacG/DUF329 family)